MDGGLQTFSYKEMLKWNMPVQLSTASCRGVQFHYTMLVDHRVHRQ